MLSRMGATDRRADRGRREAAAILRDVGEELRAARLSADLSQKRVGEAVGISHTEVSRVERMGAPGVPVTRLAAMAAVLGLRLSVRLYPAGRPLRDAAQLALMERLRIRLHRALRLEGESPLPIVGDLRAWDGAIRGPGWSIFVDAETRIRDVQALARRTALKRRDSGGANVLLLPADTRTNRAVLDAVGTALIPDAIDGRAVLAALEVGRDPAGSGVVML